MRGSGFIPGAETKASKQEYIAEKLLLRQQVEDSLRYTINVYWQTVAAQERLNLLKKIEKKYAVFTQNSKSLLKTGKSSKIDMLQAKARQIEVQGQISEQIASLANSQKDLAISLGLDLTQKKLPKTSQNFPSYNKIHQQQNLKVKEIIAQSLNNRKDYLASHRQIKASLIREKASRWNKKPQINLGIRGSQTNYHNSSSNTNNSPDSSVSAFVSIEFPFSFNKKNGIAEGRQQHGAWLQSFAQRLQNKANSKQLRIQIISNIRSLIKEYQANANRLQKSQETQNL